MKQIILFAACSCLCLHASFGQSSEKIETDRPGKAQTPYVVPKRTLQLETGFEWLKEDEDQQELQHPELVVKYGLFRWLELRTRILTVTDKVKRPSSSLSGLEPIEVGVKALITEGKGMIPHTSLSAQFGIPGLASKEFTAVKLYPKIRLNLENELSDKLYLEYNVAAEWDGFDDVPVWMLAVSPHLEVGKKFQFMVEAFSELQRGKSAELSADAGAIYWISNNTMVDINAGFGISKSAPKSFADIGFSFRL